MKKYIITLIPFLTCIYVTEFANRVPISLAIQ